MNPFISKKIVFFQFFCMIFLVFVHSYNLQEQLAFPYSPVTEKLTVTSFTESLLANCILRFRLPLLFMISGYLLALQDTRPFTAKIKTKIKGLLVPYVLWSCFGIAVYYMVFFIVYNFNLHHYFPAFQRIKFQSFYQLIHTILFNPISFQLWYLKVLFLLNLLYPVIDIGLRYIPAIVLVGTGLVWITSEKTNLLQGEGLFFFSLGALLSKGQVDIQRKPAWLNIKAGAFAFFLLAFLKTYLTFHSALLPGSATEYVLIFLYRVVEAIGIIVAWFGMDKVVDYCMNNQYFQKWKSYSFFIYAVHAPFCIYLMDVMLSITSGFQHGRFFCFALCPVIAIIVSLMLARLLEKLFPRLYFIATGRRGGQYKMKQSQENTTRWEVPQLSHPTQ